MTVDIPLQNKQAFVINTFSLFSVIKHVSSGGGLISMSVPSEEEFGFEWRVNGMIVAGENSATFPLPNTAASKDIHIQGTVFSNCGNVTQTFIIPADPLCLTSSPLPSCSSMSCEYKCTVFLLHAIYKYTV